VIRGAIVVALLFGVFGIWSLLAPLTSAAIAPGVVQVDSHRKTVQHPDGGIIRDILVRDGDVVKQGQVLVQLDSLDARADLRAIRGQIGALEAEIATSQKQLPNIEEQLSDMRSLYKKGYARKPQLLELELQATKLKGDIAANESRLDGLYEQKRKAEAKVGRENVTAPQDGVVMNLRVHTRGGVIEPGDDILDLVPDDDALVLSVKVRPIDIDVVRPGLRTVVRFVAYKQRTTPTVDGKVTRVSADAVIDQLTGNAYFLATVEVDADELSRVPAVKLYPGMPVEAAIVTGKRTVLAFLFQPFTDSFARAFREE
jgi:multidrug efflux pump subunit AcrA (membrane-fusion protein)